MKFTKVLVALLIANLFLVAFSLQKRNRRIDENNESNESAEASESNESSEASETGEMSETNRLGSKCCGNSGTIFKSLQNQIKSVIDINKNKNKKLEEQKTAIKNEVGQINKIFDEIQLNTKNMLNERKRREEERKNIGKYLLSRSQIIRNLNEFNKIKQWIGTPFRLEQCYSSSRHTRNSQTFHQLCDNKGPTLTIVENTAGVKFGGFTKLSWDTSNNYKQGDGSDFIFSLTYNLKNANSQYRQYTTYNNANYFPTFGGGHDIYLASNCFDTNSNYANPHSYDRNRVTGSSYNYQVSKLEVYVVHFHAKKKLK